MPGSKPMVSVIVPVHRAGVFLEALLEGLQQQTVRNFEVILVGFKNKALAARSLPNRFFYVEAINRWPDVKRNLGAQNARAELLAYIDEDCIPDKNWVAVIQQSFFKNPSVGGLEGATRGEQKRLLGHTIQNEKGGWYPTCNMAFRKKDFQEVKGFDEQYHFFREDMDIVFKLKCSGKKILFEPSMRVFHPERSVSWKSFFNEIFLVKGDVRLYKKFPALYHERFGFLCRGSFKQSAFVWFLSLLFIFGLGRYYFLPVIALILLILFRYWISMRGKNFSPMQGTQFVLATTARDLVFVFAFVYYWLTIRPPHKDTMHPRKKEAVA